MRGPFLHSGRGRVFDFLLCSEEGLGNGTPYTPKALTLIKSLSRALESALDTRGGSRPGSTPARVRRAAPRTLCSVPLPGPAGMDASTEGLRIPPARQGQRVQGQGSLVWHLWRPLSVLFTFLRPSRPVNNPEFSTSRQRLRYRDPLSFPQLPAPFPPVLLKGENSPMALSSGRPWAPSALLLGTHDAAGGCSCVSGPGLYRLWLSPSSEMSPHFWLRGESRLLLVKHP